MNMKNETTNNTEQPNEINMVLAPGFICQGCKHELPMDFNLRTEGFCYLCDPNITLAECLSDEPIERVPKACS